MRQEIVVYQAPPKNTDAVSFPFVSLTFNQMFFSVCSLKRGNSFMREVSQDLFQSMKKISILPVTAYESRKGIWARDAITVPVSVLILVKISL